MVRFFFPPSTTLFLLFLSTFLPSLYLYFHFYSISISSPPLFSPLIFSLLPLTSLTSAPPLSPFPFPSPLARSGGTVVVWELNIDAAGGKAKVKGEGKGREDREW